MIKAWKKLAIIFTIGIVITIFGLTTGILWSTIYTSILNSQISLTPTSTNYGLWKETPIPMYLKIYMFNLTNPEDFTSSNGAKPNFVEMGPYVFREVDYKVGLVWNENNTITFQRKKIWHFDESMSKGSLSDNVTNINPVTATVGYILRHKSPLVRDVANRVMKAIGQKLIITKTVNELLFEGYNDTMLILARKLGISNIPFTKFGWFYERNGSASYDGTFNMLTGTTSLTELGVLKEWNYKSRVSNYPGKCGIIKGTNGDLWPPLPNNQTITFFVPDICTSISAVYDNVTIHEGLTGVRYVNDDTLFDNGTKIPWRKCYCGGECIPSGALNVSMCKWGAPAFISSPHFYLADSSYRKNITGMNPSREKHQMSISLEPNTGVPLKIGAQLQLNLLVNHDNVMSVFKNVTTTFVPMLWFTQEAWLTANYASKVKLIIILQTLGSVTCYGIAAIGILIMSIGTFLCIRENLRGDENQVLLTGSDNGDVHHIEG